MSVYTRVTPLQLSSWLADYPVGSLQSLEPIAAGIENSNYFVDTTVGRFVLTLFEKLQPPELPFYLGLMSHLSTRGIPCPDPVADRGGRVFGMLCGKPATLVTRLPGRDVERAQARHCRAVGAMLARMHQAGADYSLTMANPRGTAWWQEAAHAVLPRMPAGEARLLDAELTHQARLRFDGLARGPIHADLFRDNVLFDAGSIGGVIDFYFACNDVLLYDVAIAVNDWCIEADGELDPVRTRALLSAYAALRPLDAEEVQVWADLLRAAALRFWVSRLYDLHCPRPGELTYAKDPAHFRQILQARIARPSDLSVVLTFTE